MIDKETWMPLLIEKLQDSFGPRLLFAGLQGSYRRGEATEESDIDVVAVIESLSFDDLRVYRSLIQTMPESGKACGFVSGNTDLINWPRHEIFQLKQDTEEYFGRLDGLIGAYDRNDIRRGIQISAANLYHAAQQHYLSGGPDWPAALKPLYKAVFFPLQIAHYLRVGEYCQTKSELNQQLSGREKQLLDVSLHWDEYKDDITAHPDTYFQYLSEWCQTAMA